jgi:phosphatidate cytidylyltransferase
MVPHPAGTPGDGSRETSAARHGDLPARLATAAAGIPVLLVLIVVGGPIYTAAVALLLALGAAEICRAAGLRASDPLAIVSAAITAALAIVTHIEQDAQAAVLAALVITALVVEVLRGEVERGFARGSAAIAACVYVGLLGSYLVALRRLDDGRDWVLLMLFTTFATDTGAYAVGRAFGRRKLAPRVSPGKTVAGAVGGLAAGALAAVGLTIVLDLQVALPQMAGVGALAAVAAQAGDLTESLLKRALGVKDMGRIFPGHGGVLDRLDSILFVAPVLYLMVRWIIQ